MGKFDAGEIGVLPIMHPEIIDPNTGEPADQAGLKPGDVIMAANGERDISRERVIELIRAHEGKPLTSR